MSLWRVVRALLLVCLVCGLAAGAALYAYTHRPQPVPVTDQALFQGVRYTRRVEPPPHPRIVHIVHIDLTAPGVALLVTPPQPTGGWVYSAQTTSAFAAESGVQLAINGDYFTPWWDWGPHDYYPHSGDGVNVAGAAMSRGVHITDGYAPRPQPALYIGQDNRASFTPPANPADRYHILSGSLMLLEAGSPPAFTVSSYINGLHPRTTVALDATGTTMLWVVVDGRQPGYSDGISLPDLAALIRSYGASDALNLDGGGSSVLVMRGHDGAPVHLSTPIRSRIPGWERPVANHLGLFALPLD